jgi:Tfp pilus assembly protein PilF
MSIFFSLIEMKRIRRLMIDARALFERSALNISPEKARPLWDAWARYEYMYGDLAAVNKLEARFKEVFPNGMCNSSSLILAVKVCQCQTRDENSADSQILR